LLHISLMPEVSALFLWNTAKTKFVIAGIGRSLPHAANDL